MIKRSILILYVLAIALVSLLPADDIPDIELFPYSDKLIHCGMYAGLTFLFFWNWPDKFKGKRAIIPMIFVMILGFAMEVLQSFFNLGRTFDLWDQFSNMLGFFPGMLFWLWVVEIFYSSKPLADDHSE